MVKTGPPPIPVRPRSIVRIELEPEPPRTVRSKLVGRADALATLRDVVTRAADFQAPQLVTIVGNQGTGKTRLINELITLISQGTKTRVIHGAAERDPTGKPVRLSTVASVLRDRFELTPNPDDTSRLRFTHEIRDVMKSDHCLLYTSPSPRDGLLSRMPSSA